MYDLTYPDTLYYISVYNNPSSSLLHMPSILLRSKELPLSCTSYTSHRCGQDRAVQGGNLVPLWGITLAFSKTMMPNTNMAYLISDVCVWGWNVSLFKYVHFVSRLLLNSVFRSAQPSFSNNKNDIMPIFSIQDECQSAPAILIVDLQPCFYSSTTITVRIWHLKLCGWPRGRAEGWG